MSSDDAASDAAATAALRNLSLHSSSDSAAAASSASSGAASASDAVAAEVAADSELPLPAHFYKCQTAYMGQFVTCKVPRTPQSCAVLLASLRALQSRIDAAALFSSNEAAADDLSTASIKFLTVPFITGQVESSFPCGVAERAQHVLAAARAFGAFVHRLESYGLAEQQAGELEEFKRCNKELIAALTAPPAPAGSRPPMPGMRGGGGPRVDPNAARTAKIARMRRSKELNAQLEVLQQSRARSYRQRKKADHIQAASADDDDVQDDLLDSGSDEDDVRAFYMLLLQQQLMSTVDTTRSALDEAAMLAHFRDVESQKPKHEQLAHMSDEQRRDTRNSGLAPGAKPVMHKMTPQSLNEPIPAHMKHLLQNVAQPANAATSLPASALARASAAVSRVPGATSVDALIAQRASARSEVFKLTNQPTMSIEEWAEGEIAAGRMAGPSSDRPPRQPDPRRIYSAADREQAAEMEAQYRATVDEDNGELGHEDGQAGAAKDELKTEKDRAWDNWKDEHQKGVGNTMK